MVKYYFLALLLGGCRGVERDTLAGDWDGEIECGGVEYEVEALIEEVEEYSYTGQFLFKMSRAVEGGDFKANFIYDFTAIQGIETGGQDIYFDSTWSEMGCQTVYDNGDSQDGGCQSNGLDTSDYENAIGDIMMRFDGRDTLSIDDDNCDGEIEREGSKE